MGLLDAYQDSTDTALRVMADRPLDPETPEPKHSAWSVVPRGIAAAGLEIAGNMGDMSVAAQRRNVTPIFASGDPLRDIQDTAQFHESAGPLEKDASAEAFRNPVSKEIYSAARDLRPDPLTAGMAENIMFGLSKGLTKAIGTAVVLGPAGGAVAFGASEGMTAAEDLAEQGVDIATRTKVGAVTAGVNAVGMALPLAGNTLAKTAGLVAVGGPASFIAQQAASRAILENADYGAIAKQYDPLDPTGLALSVLLPAGFAAYAKSGAIMAAMRGTPKPATDPAAATVKDSLTPEQAAPTQEQMDAVMVHNLTAARDAHDASDPATLAETLPRPETAPEVMAAEPAKVGAGEAAVDVPTASDPHIASVLNRVESLTQQQPDMPVALREDGTQARLVDEIEAIRRQAREGTDTDFGADDAPLLKVAADCFLSAGGGAI